MSWCRLADFGSQNCLNFILGPLVVFVCLFFVMQKESIRNLVVVCFSRVGLCKELEGHWFWALLMQSRLKPDLKHVCSLPLAKHFVLF